MLLVVSAALAAFPEQISLTAMDDYEGASTQPTTRDAADDYVITGYQQLVRELGTAIANKPLAPGSTLGLNGYHVGVATTVAFIGTGPDSAGNPSGWTLADPDEKASPVMFIPWVQVRKGLPLSLEVGANFGWIGLSQTGVVGAYGRFAPLEGYHYVPEVALQAGYSGYVGNDELEVGVVDLSATIGYTLKFGSVAGVHDSQFSPYVSLGVNEIHGAPRSDLSRTDLGDRITEVDGTDSTSEFFDDSFAPFQLGGGFRIRTGDFSATVAASWSPDIIPTVNFGLGYTH